MLPPPMFTPSPIYHKTRNNTRLANGEEAQVRRAMNETFNKLKVVESETARLRDRLVVLDQRKKDTEHFIKVHHGLLSPIRRLHLELLQEIFCRCLPTAHNSVLSFKEAPLLLGRVCRQWQRIAYSTPALWSSLHIVLAPLTYPAAEARLEAIDAWLSRSGILPLSISMSTLPVISMDGNTPMHEFQPYFILVTKHTRRWKSIHLGAEHWDPMCFLMDINADDLPLLETFHIEGGGPIIGAYSKKGGVLSAPLLRDLSVHPYSLRLLDLPVDWNHLTSFHSSLFDLSGIFKLLSLCSNLETCILKGNISFYSPIISQFPDSWSKVLLPKLRTLIINEMEPVHNNDLLTVLNNLYTPALRHLSCQLSSWFPPVFPSHPLPEHLPSLEVFSSFFQRLNEPLEELSIYAFSGKTTYLMELLYLFPGLKRLSVNCSYYISYSSGFPIRLFNDRLLLGFIPYERRSHYQPLGEEAEEDQVKGDDSILASSTCLCPNLEVLNVIGAGCSKHVLLEFLHSRLVDHDKYDIARLRRFGISSSELRLKSDDVKEEIKRLTEESGLVVELEHLPAPAPTHPPPPCSPPDPFIQGLPVF